MGGNEKDGEEGEFDSEEEEEDADEEDEVSSLSSSLVARCQSFTRRFLAADPPPFYFVLISCYHVLSTLTASFIHFLTEGSHRNMVRSLHCWVEVQTSPKKQPG
jgi:hypothetical protein